MRRYILGFILLILTISISAQDMESVLKKSSSALGLASREKIVHLKTTGHVVMAGTEAKIPFTLLQSKPGKIRVETTVFGFKAIQTYDGNTAWMLNPSQGVEAVKTDPRDMAFISAATAIDGPFSSNHENNFKKQYEGMVEHKGMNAYVITWYSDTEKLRYFINPSTFLIDLVRYEYQKNGGWYSMEYKIDSYMNYAKSKFPSRVSAIINGVEMASLTVTEIEIKDNIKSEKYGKPTY